MYAHPMASLPVPWVTTPPYYYSAGNLLVIDRGASPFSLHIDPCVLLRKDKDTQSAPISPHSFHALGNSSFVIDTHCARMTPQDQSPRATGFAQTPETTRERVQERY
jgi:hypothetical protein